MHSPVSSKTESRFNKVYWSSSIVLMICRALQIALALFEDSNYLYLKDRVKQGDEFMDMQGPSCLK